MDRDGGDFGRGGGRGGRGGDMMRGGRFGGRGGMDGGRERGGFDRGFDRGDRGFDRGDSGSVDRSDKGRDRDRDRGSRSVRPPSSPSLLLTFHFSSPPSTATNTINRIGIETGEIERIVITTKTAAIATGSHIHSISSTQFHSFTVTLASIHKPAQALTITKNRDRDHGRDKDRDSEHRSSSKRDDKDSKFKDSHSVRRKTDSIDHEVKYSVKVILFSSVFR
jgi:hypothetical protein